MNIKKLILLPLVIIVISALVVSANYLTVGAPLSETLETDPRNKGIEVSAHYYNYIFPSTLVFDLKSISDNNSAADVFRVLLQFSSKIKNKDFETVQLAFRGTEKFQLKGSYFKELGQEFGEQNPIYTMRTFPENVYHPDGAHAYDTWTGGIIGVLAKQLNDFNEFHRDWYIRDMQSQSAQ